VTTPVRALVLVGLVVLVALMWLASFANERLETVASGIAALAPRRFESLSVVAAGTGGTYENHLRLGPAIAVGFGETLVLVDAGRGTAQALRRAGIPVEQPTALLLTSLLPENVLGLDDWLWGVTLAGDGEARRILGPPGTRALVEALLAAHRAGAQVGAAAFGVAPEPALEVVEADDGFETALGELTLSAKAQRGGPLPALAWRIEVGGRSAVVSGAGFDPEALVDAARGADLWVHEALVGASLEQALAAGGADAEPLAREAALHTRLEDAGALAARAGARRLALVRLRPPPVYAFEYRRQVAASYSGPVAIPDDGETLEVAP
jgi:ribonuclease BN (tRNA processing enzyme)